VRGERGSAIVEFALLGSLVFGVLVQAVVLFGVLHRSTLATSAAAREYGRAIVVADSADEAAARGSMVVEQAARNHGLAPGSLHARVEGRRARGELLTVRVTTDVPVFSLPFVGAVVPSVSVPVEATHAVQVDRYRSGP
jgi:hypothetical protein